MEVDSDANSRFLGRTLNFLNWFQALPGATFHKDIAIEDLRERNAGRGIIAKADIEPDTVLFTIPRNAIICTATSTLKSLLPEVFDLEKDDGQDSDDEDANSSSQDSWTLLILVMIYEFLQGESSRWKPYLDVLPSGFDTPMFWSPSELSELQASALVAKVGKEEADSMIKFKILAVIRAHESIFLPAGSPKLHDDQLLELAHRMGSAIMAYAFDLEKEDDKAEEGNEEDDEWVEDREGRTMLGMVPMADMLNADAEFNAHVNHGEDALTATALRTIRAGEEILNYYGPLSSGELLRRYGYVTPKHARYDVVELPWGLVQQELRQRVGSGLGASEWAKVKEVVEADENFEEGFVLERSSEDPDSTGQLGSDAVFDGLPEELGEQCKRFLKAVKKVGSDEAAAQALSDKDMRKQVYLTSVLGALQARERQYPTSLEDDEQLINSRRVTGRQGMAVWVRKGEKQVIREAQSWIRGQLPESQIKASDRRSEDDTPAAKRRRI